MPKTIPIKPDEPVEFLPITKQAAATVALDAFRAFGRTCTFDELFYDKFQAAMRHVAVAVLTDAVQHGRVLLPVPAKPKGILVVEEYDRGTRYQRAKRNDGVWFERYSLVSGRIGRRSRSAPEWSRWRLLDDKTWCPPESMHQHVQTRLPTLAEVPTCKQQFAKRASKEQVNRTAGPVPT